MGLRQIAGNQIIDQCRTRRERSEHSCIRDRAGLACGALILAITHAGSVTQRPASLVTRPAATRVRMPPAQIPLAF